MTNQNSKEKQGELAAPEPDSSTVTKEDTGGRERGNNESRFKG